MGISTSNDYTISSIVRALQILRLFTGNNKYMTLSEISAKTGVTKSSVLRVLKTLESESFVRYNPETRKYALDIAVYDLCVNGFDFISIKDKVRPILERAAHRSGLLVHLTVLEQDTLRVIVRIWPDHDGADILGLIAPVGSNISIHCTGAGKILFAFSSEACQERLLSRCKFEAYSERTVTSKEEFLMQTKQALKDGYATNDGEHEPYLKCIAYPVYDRNNNVVAALSLSGLRQTFTEGVTANCHIILREIIEELRDSWY